MMKMKSFRQLKVIHDLDSSSLKKLMAIGRITRFVISSISIMKSQQNLSQPVMNHHQDVYQQHNRTVIITQHNCTLLRPDFNSRHGSHPATHCS